MKECGCTTLNIMHFKKVPKCVIIELVYFIALWLNAFQANMRIAEVYFPREIITGQQLDYNKHCEIDFGEYVEIHDEPSPINDMT